MIRLEPGGLLLLLAYAALGLICSFETVMLLILVLVCIRKETGGLVLLLAEAALGLICSFETVMLLILVLA